MHDVFEGCITLLLTCFFLLCFELKIFSKDQLDNWIKCYDFGVLNNANVPSGINFDKRSLGQNASQALCLFKHLPFILNKFRDHPKLQDAWKCIETLLQICEIISSYEITELELDRLQKLITLHLELFQKCFKHPFIPKQHFLLHYASIMRAVGPLIYFSMMRFDAKHKIFKNMRHATNNFISINKTLAYEHQKLMCMHGFGYKDNFNHGVLKLIEDESILALLRDADFLTVNSVAYITRYLHFNEYKYSKGLFIVHNNSFQEIVHIICIAETYFFICHPYITKQFDSFLNSFEVEKMENCHFKIIKFGDLQYAKTHEIKVIGRQNYIILDSLDLKTQINQ